MQTSKVGINQFYLDLYGQQASEHSLRNQTIYSSAAPRSVKVTIDAQKVCHVQIPAGANLPQNASAATTKLAQFIRGSQDILILAFEGDKEAVLPALPEDWKNGDPSLRTDSADNKVRIWKRQPVTTAKTAVAPLSLGSRLIANLTGWKLFGPRASV